ncbi:MAG: bifunctional folylpolyglutamate synthase/dihydrofolate synthase [Anaerolineae bacterium]|nr:bifunctional folylpolyglutamate synthase/dihydrofolate synthase [Anaerolineae bacterium]MCB0245816.1 bifunctional folylpolyglutamate synthase/dihydrofolate synthase [Anaerolineae bacterium]
MSLSPSYQAALDYIYNYVDYERRRSVAYTEVAWDVDRTRRVLAALGNPHQRYRIVHVAGSKGKGSTAAGIESILRAAGLRTGFFTSPHLHTFRERIRVDGALIGRSDVVALLEQCKPAIESVPGITTFEIMTVLAMMYFAARRVQWAVLEVGLGGRLDSTNVVVPEVSVITRISLEHTALLGNTLDAIAREKAGIIKPGVPVVVAPQAGEALAAITETAVDRRAPVILVGSDWTWELASSSFAGQVFSVHHNPPASRPENNGTAGGHASQQGIFDLTTPLLGEYQLANQTTAVAVSTELARQGVSIDDDAVRRGLAAVYWPGRLEVLRAGNAGDAGVVVDSAHTVDSVHLLCDAIAEFFPGRRMSVILGISSDKDASAILSAFAARGAALFLTRSRHPRAMDPDELADLTVGLMDEVDVAICQSVQAALVDALRDADSQTVVCVTGSLFVAAEGREAWLALNPGAFPAGDWAYEAEPTASEWQVSQVPNANSFRPFPGSPGNSISRPEAIVPGGLEDGRTT